jgi:predicted DCC family thiol-disulfide oxidoreductase YuxK
MGRNDRNRLMPNTSQTRTLYNADCPVCNAEICHYAAYAKARALPLGFEDLNTGELADWGVTADAAMRRLHVLHQGQLYVGFDAFLILWDQMPRYRFLARLGRLPLIRPLARWGYERIAAPLLYGAHKRRMAKRTAKHQATK